MPAIAPASRFTVARVPLEAEVPAIAPASRFTVARVPLEAEVPAIVPASAAAVAAGCTLSAMPWLLTLFRPVAPIVWELEPGSV